MNFFRVFKYGWSGFWRNIWVSTATIGIMTLALSVVSTLLVIGNVTETFISDLQGKVDISVYFAQEADEGGIFKLRFELESQPEVREVEYVSRTDALDTFKERHKGNELLMASLQELDQNPFQASLNIKAQEASQFESIVSFVEASEISPDIAKINFKENEKVIQRLTEITSSIENIGVFFTFLLSFIAMLITFNTIRLVIYNYRDEISVMKLVGAGDWFIRGPFIVTGVLYGIVSSIITWFLFLGGVWVVSEQAGSIFPGSDIYGYWTNNFLLTMSILVVLGVGFGAISSFVAVRRYLTT
jgi:cell division transport system permease protein